MPIIYPHPEASSGTAFHGSAPSLRDLPLFMGDLLLIVGAVMSAVLAVEELHPESEAP
ncbi:MAG: hypothetical protein ABSD92_02920 [Candidatus Bathyarchaeia archaeon]